MNNIRTLLIVTMVLSSVLLLQPWVVNAQGIDPPPSPELNLLPPPPGVIVLKPNKVREQAATCPDGFDEVDGYGGWRFCVDPQNPQPIPPLWSPPIAGIPLEDVREILKRHEEDLMQLPGVEGVGLRADGIHIITSNPEVVPKEIEGVPIIVHPATGRIRKGASHTTTMPVRPLHGATAIKEQSLVGTLTGVVLSQGRPWLIFPAHLLQQAGCSTDPPCSRSSGPLNTCQHYPLPGDNIPVILQPPSVSSPPTVGYAWRWTRLVGGLPSTTNDVAAAFMDTDLAEGNGSLSADRRVSTDTTLGIPFSGIPIPELPPPGLQVTMRRANGPPHQILLTVVETDASRTIQIGCGGQEYKVNNQIIYAPATSFLPQGGDSGSPMFDGAGRIAGMFNWCDILPGGSNPCGCTPSPCTPEIGGSDAIHIQSTLGFDKWYGTATVNDNTFGGLPRREYEQ